MKPSLRLTLLSLACLLPIQQGSRQTNPMMASQVDRNHPRALVDVSPGMPRDSVIAGLSERYHLLRLSSAPDSTDEQWMVMDQAGTGAVGNVSFYQGRVRSVEEWLSESENNETLNFVRNLFLLLKPYSEPSAGRNDAASSTRTIRAVIELDEKHSRTGGAVDVYQIDVRSGGEVLEIFASDDSLLQSPHPGADVKIVRIKGGK